MNVNTVEKFENVLWRSADIEGIKCSLGGINATGEVEQLAALIVLSDHRASVDLGMTHGHQPAPSATIFDLGVDQRYVIRRALQYTLNAFGMCRILHGIA